MLLARQHSFLSWSRTGNRDPENNKHTSTPHGTEEWLGSSHGAQKFLYQQRDCWEVMIYRDQHIPRKSVTLWRRVQRKPPDSLKNLWPITHWMSVLTLIESVHFGLTEARNLSNICFFYRRIFPKIKMEPEGSCEYVLLPRSEDFSKSLFKS